MIVKKKKKDRKVLQLSCYGDLSRGYAHEVFALGLSGEGGLTRAERQAMASHWAERAAAEEAAAGSRRSSSRGKSGRDAAELAKWQGLTLVSFSA